MRNDQISQSSKSSQHPSAPALAWQHSSDYLSIAARPALERIRRDRRRVTPRLHRMLEHLEKHLFDPRLNVNHLKKACAIRDNSIAILFHSQVGQSPKSYLSERRLETASRLLRDTQLRVWRIAEMVGYSGLGVFSKAFNRWANQRPNAFRRQARQLESEVTGRCPSAEQGLPTVDFMDRALSGALTDGEADQLLRRLMGLYPDLSSALATEWSEPEPIPDAPGLAAGT